MNINNLVTMANQIGTFFESYPDQAEASTEIVSHLNRFWAPRMRKQLYAHIDDNGGAGLTPIVLAAIAAHRMATPEAISKSTQPHDKPTAAA